MKHDFSIEEIRVIMRAADVTADLPLEDRCLAIMKILNGRDSLYVTSKAFRARLAEFCDACEKGSDVYITRPGGAILHLDRLGDAEAEHMRRNRTPDTELKAPLDPRPTA